MSFLSTEEEVGKVCLCSTEQSLDQGIWLVSEEGSPVACCMLEAQECGFHLQCHRKEVLEMLSG